MKASFIAWPVQQPKSIFKSSEMTIGAWLVLVASVFNLFLCFVSSRHWITIGNSGIIFVEFMVLSAGLVLLRNELTKFAIQTSLLITLYLIGIEFINPGLDLKILHDLAITVVFYRLGMLASVETGNQVLWIIMILVLGVGLFELALPATFGAIFDVWSYYVNKGVIGQDTVKLSHSNLFISGNRGSDAVRTFFPGIFGSHRVSSVFLEPDSLGNFSVIGFAWCLSTAVGSVRNRLFLLLFSCFCFVLADSRYASFCCLIMLGLRLVFPVRSKLLVFFIPICVLGALILAASLNPMPGNVIPAIINDDFSGRLLFSGRLMDYWNFHQWLGLAPSQIYTADTGYAYLINNLGLPLTLYLLAVFSASGSDSIEARMMKLMISVYLATSLCVGASVFTIKTAALLWFLYGTANAMLKSTSGVASKQSLASRRLAALRPV
jgi:putative polymerase